MSVRYDASPQGGSRSGGGSSVGLILDGARDVARAATRLLEPGARPRSAVARAVRQLRLPRPSVANASACGLPRCDCPSTDLGELRKVACEPGQVPIAFRVRNTTRARRTFSLTASPLACARTAQLGTVTLSPSYVDLAAGQTAVIMATVDSSGQHRGETASAAVEIASEGCDNMSLMLAIEIEREAEVPVVDLHCCCSARPRPLRWYHHYYCDPRPHQDPVRKDMVSASDAEPAKESGVADASLATS
jgi:hypothetical protein